MPDIEEGGDIIVLQGIVHTHNNAVPNAHGTWLFFFFGTDLYILNNLLRKFSVMS